MKNNVSFGKSNPEKKRRVLLIVTIIVLAVILLGMLIAVIVMGGRQEEPPVTEPPQTDAPTQPTEEPTEPVTEPEETKPQMIPWMAELYEQNPEFAYWLKIEGTKLDDPVMYTPDDPEKYIRMSFEGNHDMGGEPFLEDICNIDPENESDNLIIYGHNMANGTKFRTLMSYKDKEYWEEHPQVTLTTMYEERTYDILAVFYDHVRYANENVFKFYKFVDAEDEDDYNRAINYYKNNALYETDVDAEYGDRLLTLVTCSDHHAHGRFVLVAREAVEEPEEAVQAVQQP